MNQQTPKVSVIIPVFNTEPYLHECLDSVVGQTMREIEIICVDDGSTDGSLAILREYEKKDDRVLVLTQPNINAGAARNNGLTHATGEYLSFLDADDVFAPDMLEKAYARAKEHGAEICVFSCSYFNDEGEHSEGNPSFYKENLPDSLPFAGTDVKNNLFRTFIGWTWDKLFLREYVVREQMKFQEQRSTNDLLFTFFALAKARRITVTDAVLAHHRTHVKTSLEATRAQSWDCYYKGLCALRDALKGAGLFERYEQAFADYSLCFCLWNLFTIAWPTQELLYYHLKLIGFRELGILGCDKGAFSDQNEYEVLQKIMEKPYSDEAPQAKDQRIAELEKRISELNACVASRDQLIFDLQNTVSFRAGRAITWLPRKLRGGVRRLKSGKEE